MIEFDPPNYYSLRRRLPDRSFSGHILRRVCVYMMPSFEVDVSDCMWMVGHFGVSYDSLRFSFTKGDEWTPDLHVWGDGDVIAILEPEPVPTEISHEGCPICLHRGEFLRGDLICPTHGAFGGIR